MSRLMRDTAKATAERFAHRIVRDFAAAANKIEADPAHVVDTVRRRPGVTPREVDEFARLLRLVGQ